MPLPFCIAVADYPDLDVRQALASAGPIDQVATGLHQCKQEAIDHAKSLVCSDAPARKRPAAWTASGTGLSM